MFSTPCRSPRGALAIILTVGSLTLFGRASDRPIAGLLADTGFTMWMAGGVKDGQSIGPTDEIGLRGVGERLTYPRNGRAERPTITSGTVIKNLTT